MRRVCLARLWALAGVLSLLCCLVPLPCFGAGGGIVVMEARTGQVLYGENEDAPRPMASTTKIMTALLTLEQPGLDVPFAVDSDAIRTEGTSMGLQAGDTVTLRALAAGMLLASGNDGANAAAVRISGSVPAFVEKMNRRAKEIGMTGTHFVTPSGLDGDGHCATPRDMALLAAEALKNPDFAAICAQKRLTVEFGQPPRPVTLYNHNRLLSEYEGCIGVKTGYTKKAGRCLVSAAERDGVTLICVTLGVYDDWAAHKSLLDRCFSKVTTERLQSALLPGFLPVAGGGRITLSLQGEPLLPRWEGAAPVKEELFLPPFAYPNLRPGEPVGWVRWKMGDRVVLQLPILAGAQLKEEPRGPDGAP